MEKGAGLEFLVFTFSCVTSSPTERNHIDRKMLSYQLEVRAVPVRKGSYMIQNNDRASSL